MQIFKFTPPDKVLLTFPQAVRLMLDTDVRCTRESWEAGRCVRLVHPYVGIPISQSCVMEEWCEDGVYRIITAFVPTINDIAGTDWTEVEAR